MTTRESREVMGERTSEFLYRRIESAAQQRVSKSAEPVSIEKAISDYLRTPEGMERYTAYREAQRAEFAKDTNDAATNVAGVTDRSAARDAAWQGIVAIAGSEEPQAIAKALETEHGRELYADYVAGTTPVLPRRPVGKAADDRASMTADQVAFLKSLESGDRVRIAKDATDTQEWRRKHGWDSLSRRDAEEAMALAEGREALSPSLLKSATDLAPDVNADGSVELHPDVHAALATAHPDEAETVKRFVGKGWPAAKVEAAITMRRIARKFNLRPVQA